MAGAGVPVSMTTIILIGEMRKKTKKQSWGLKPIKKKIYTMDQCENGCKFLMKLGFEKKNGFCWRELNFFSSNIFKLKMISSLN